MDLRAVARGGKRRRFCTGGCSVLTRPTRVGWRATQIRRTDSANFGSRSPVCRVSPYRLPASKEVRVLQAVSLRIELPDVRLLHLLEELIFTEWQGC